MNTTPDTLNNSESVESTPQIDEGQPMENNVRIEKILKLKNFGIFQDFSWENNLDPFKKFNLIYGSNRSGKTTISRIFASCEKKTTNDFEQYPENGIFEIQTSDGNTLKSETIAENPLSIRVFNQDFVNENIFFDSDSCNPIVYVSKKDIEIKNKLKLLNDQIAPLSDKYGEIKRLEKGIQKIEDNFRIFVAQTVSRFLTNKAIRDDYFSYDKARVQGKIDKIGIDGFSDKNILSNEDETKCALMSRSNARLKQYPPSDYKFSFPFDGESISNFQQVFAGVKKLLQKQVLSEMLSRLKDDPDLNKWVGQGFDLHKIKNEEVKCLFCERELDDNFLTTLSKHFNKDYENLQNTINQLKNDLSEIKKPLIPEKNDGLYPDLQDDYANEAKKLNQCIEEIKAWVDIAIKKLQNKYDNPLTLVENPKEPDDFLTLYNEIFIRLDNVITKHNDIIINHGAEVLAAQQKLELHLITDAVLTQDYKKMVADIEDIYGKKTTAKDAVDNNTSDINDLKKQNSDIGIATKKIDKYLKGFFGGEEVKLELDKDKKGYAIKRNGKIAKNLSEGEKTAIAFSYFIVKVGEGNFDESKGIIFIDDPISSFDSNFVYHCFSIIKTEFEAVGQLFISTHNFQFFNLVKEWFAKENRRVKKSNAKKDEKKSNPQEKTEPKELIPSEFFMVEYFTEREGIVRKSHIVKLDETLLNYKSEYHFLFKSLKEFSENQSVPYKDLYTIGNMARRFFDIFADFKIPNRGDQKSKMGVLIKRINVPSKKISDAKEITVYKLINDFSHNPEPTSTIEHKDRKDAIEAIKIVLEIVKESDPNHYEALVNSLTS